MGAGQRTAIVDFIGSCAARSGGGQSLRCEASGPKPAVGSCADERAPTSSRLALAARLRVPAADIRHVVPRVCHWSAGRW